MTGVKTRTAPAMVGNRRRVRDVAVALTALSALIYFLIGLRVVEVLDNPSDQTAFGLIAGGAFTIGALVISRFDRRALWILGSLAMAFVIYTYFNLASDRVPSYEMWGIVLRVLQFPLLAALVYLAFSANPDED